MRGTYYFKSEVGVAVEVAVGVAEGAAVGVGGTQNVGREGTRASNCDAPDRA